MSGRQSDEPGPLSGITLLVTRSQEQSGELGARLAARGGRIVEAPVIAFVDPGDWADADRAIGCIDSYDWILFTSANAVLRFLKRCGSKGVSSDRLAHPRIAAIGPATAESLEERGLVVSATPAAHRAEGLIEALGRNDLAGLRILLPRAEVAREILPTELRSMGAVVDVVTVYRTVAVPVTDEVRGQLASGAIDVVTFTSSSTVTNLVSGVGGPEALAGTALAVIGPVTAETVRRHGLTPEIEASRSTIPDLVEAITAWARKRG